MRYTDIVMDHFMNPRHTGQLIDADGVGRVGSEECGDVIRVWIKVKNDRLVDVRHQVLGCPAAIASCSMMTELATGLTLNEAANLTDDRVARSLGGLPPQKYHCSNLAATALHNAIENYLTAQKKPPAGVKITTLINNVMPHPLHAEHGLAFWIEYGGQNILFDTGQTDALVENAAMLDIDLSRTDAVILSHGHYDHTGGLKTVLDRAPNAAVYLHPNAPRVRYSCPAGKTAKNIAMPQQACEKIAELAAKNKVLYTANPHAVYPGVMVTGAIPRLTDYEDTGGPFYLDQQGQTPDAIEDDQALVITTGKGLVVISGCAHAGVVNTLSYVQKLSDKPIHAVLGGTHLRAASPERIEKTFLAIEAYGVQTILPCHCTGDNPLEQFKSRFPNTFSDIQNNIRITI